jgi:hypothetical protein
MTEFLILIGSLSFVECPRWRDGRGLGAKAGRVRTVPNPR